MTYVSVIIPTFNKSPLVCDIVRNLNQQTFKDFEIIVVDDGSSDNTVRKLKLLRREERHLKIKVLETGLTDQFGMCNAINLGLQNAKGPIALLINDDIYLHPTCIEQHTIVHRQTNLRHALIGPRFRSPPYRIGGTVLQEGKVWQKHIRTHTTGQICDNHYVYCKREMVSSNLSMSTDLLCKIGGYNEFFTQYTGAIDRELYYRLEKNNTKVLYVWQAQAYAIRYNNSIYHNTKWMQDNEFRDGLNVSQWKRQQMRYSEKMELQAQQHPPHPIVRRGI